VVLFESRSGSTFLIEALNSHSQICAEKEYFASLETRIRRGIESPDVQMRWLREFYAFKNNEDAVSVGFKTKLRHVLDPKLFAQLLAEFDVKIILLTRRNRVKLLVSFFNALRLSKRTGDWNLYRESDQAGLLYIDPQEFNDRMRYNIDAKQRLDKYVRDLKLPTLALSYEDLVLNSEHTIKSVCDYLEVAYTSLQAKTIKNTDDNLRNVISNFDEIYDLCVGTEFEKMFD
jgi:LPS sulfotransferase NodH